MSNSTQGTDPETCPLCGNPLDQRVAVEDCPQNFHAHNDPADTPAG